MSQSYSNYDDFYCWFKSLSTKGKSRFAKDNKIEIENPDSSSMKPWITLKRKEWLEEIKFQFETDRPLEPKYTYSCYQ